MSWDQTGANYATIATGVSALSAAYVWIRKQVEERRARLATVKARNWSGYIEPTGINDWFVRLAYEPPTPDGRITLQVVTRDGESDPQMAGGLRRVVERDGRLARAPSEAEMSWLVSQRMERSRTGFPVR